MNVFNPFDCKGCEERRKKIIEHMEGFRDRLRRRAPDPKTLPPIKNIGAAVPQKVDKKAE